MGTIGLFDSGVGGLSVLKQLWMRFPNEDYIYFADSLHMPYGPRSPHDIERIVLSICDFLFSQRVRAIVMACNTSSALVLPLAQKRLEIPVIGVLQPGARAALRVSARKRIGVMATEGTVRSGAYARALSLLSPEARVFSQACPMLAPLVEQGILEGDEVRSALTVYLAPLLAQNIDTLILGCTHYPFLSKAIQALLPAGVELVDPAVETVQELERIIRWPASTSPDRTVFYVSGSIDDFERVAEGLIGFRPTSRQAYFRELATGLAVELE